MRHPSKKSSAFGERGVVAAEFALLLPVIVLIIAGLVEGGHLWHLQHTITNASREGARAAILYNPPYSAAGVESVAKTTVDNYLKNYLPNDGTSKVWTTEVGGGIDESGNLLPIPPAYNTGSSITVRVTTTEGLMLLDKIIPGFQDIAVQAVTTMKLE
jgi:Flp pilus assembly protein TadG